MCYAVSLVLNYLVCLKCNVSECRFGCQVGLGVTTFQARELQRTAEFHTYVLLSCEIMNSANLRRGFFTLGKLT